MSSALKAILLIAIIAFARSTTEAEKKQKIAELKNAHQRLTNSNSAIDWMSYSASIIRPIENMNMDNGSQFLQLSRLLDNYMIYWVSKTNDRFFYHMQELSIYNNNLILETATVGSQSLNLGPSMVHNFVFRGIKEFLNYIIVASYDIVQNTYFFSFVDGLNNLINFSLPDLNDKIKILFTASCVKKIKDHDLHDGKYDCQKNKDKLRILVDYKDREKNLDVLIFLWYDLGNTILYVDLDLRSLKIRGHRFIRYSNFKEELPTSIKILKNRSFLFSQNKKGYLFPKTYFYENYQQLSEVSDNFYILNSDDLSTLDHLNEDIYYTTIDNYIQMLKIRFNVNKIESLSTFGSFIMYSKCPEDSQKIVTKDFFGCIVIEKKFTHIYLINYRHPANPLKFVLKDFGVFNEGQYIQIKEGLKNDHLVLCSFKEVVILFYSMFKPVREIKPDQSLSRLNLLNTSHKNTHFVDNENVFQAIRSSDEFFIFKSDIQNVSDKEGSVANISLFAGITHEFELTDKNKNFLKINFQPDMPENRPFQIVYFRETITRAKISLYRTTGLFGVEINVHMSNNVFKFIVSAQNINNFITGSVSDEYLNLQRGVISKAKIENYFYIGNKVFVEYPLVIGYFDFERANSFVEVHRHSSNYLIVQPLAFDRCISFLLYLYNDKLEIYQGSKFIAYANFALNQSARSLPLILGSYDENFPFYYFFLIEPNTLHYAEMLFMTFVHVEVNSVSLPEIKGTIVAFRSFKDYIIFISTQAERIIINVFKFERSKRLEMSAFSTELNGEECLNPVYQMIFNTRPDKPSLMTAKLIICVRSPKSHEEVLYYLSITSSSCCKLHEFSSKIMVRPKSDNLFRVSKLRTLNSEYIEEKLIVIRQVTSSSSASGADNKFLKFMNNHNAEIVIIKFMNQPVLEVKTRNFNDFFKNDYKLSLQIQPFGVSQEQISHMKEDQKSLDIQFSVNCLKEFPHQIVPRNSNKSYHFDTNNKLTKLVFIRPLEMFDGEVFDYKAILSNHFESFFKMIEMDDPFKLTKIIDLSLVLKTPFEFEKSESWNDKQYFFNKKMQALAVVSIRESSPDLVIYNIRDLLVKVADRQHEISKEYKNKVNLSEKEPQEPKAVFRIFYIYKDIFLVVNTDNTLALCSLYDFNISSKSYFQHTDRIFDAKGYFVFEGIIAIFAKTDPFDVNFSTLLIFYFNNNTLRLLNSHFQRITSQQIVVLHLKEYLAIVKLTERFILEFNLFPELMQLQNVTNQVQICLRCLFDNDEILLSLLKQLTATTIKCFVSPKIDKGFSIVTCVLMFPDFYYLKIVFKVKAMNVEIVSTELIPNYPAAAGLTPTFRSLAISDNIIVSAFIVSGKLSLYIYSTQSKAIVKNKFDSDKLNLCNEGILKRIAKAYKRLELPVRSESLSNLYLSNSQLDFVVDNKFYRYQILLTLSGIAKKYNLVSKHFEIYANRDDKESMYKFDNNLNIKVDSSKMNLSKGLKLTILICGTTFWVGVMFFLFLQDKKPLKLPEEQSSEI
jgi:hypothetical protein